MSTGTHSIMNNEQNELSYYVNIIYFEHLCFSNKQTETMFV